LNSLLGKREIMMSRDNIQSSINEKSSEILVDIIKPMNTYILGFSDTFLGYYSREKLANDPNFRASYRRLFEKLTSGNLNDKVLTINLLLSLEVGTVFNRLTTLDQESPFTIAISNILSANYFSNTDKQFLIEAFSYDYQYNFFRYMLNNTVSASRIVIFQEFHGKLITGFRSLLNRYEINNKALYNELLADGLEKRVVDVLNSFPNHDAVVSISFSTLLNIMTVKGLTRQEVCQQIGKDVLKFHNLENPTNKIKFDNELIMQIGLILLENMLLRLPILETVNINEVSNGKVTTRTMINLKPNFTELFIRNRLNPMLLPMVCKPIAWDSNLSSGGYLTPELQYITNVNHGFIHENPKNAGESKVSNIQIQAINTINSVEFRINSDLLNIYLEDWFGEGNLFDGMNKLHPESNSKVSIHSKKYQEIQAHNGLYWTYYNTLNLANLFRNNGIWIPTFMDFRGRIYPYVSYLNYQGNDLARSLLHFAATEVVNLKGYEYIEYYLAALFGYSNKSFPVRSRWVAKNLDNMVYKFQNDRDAFFQEIINSAKEPYQFISVFMEIIKFLENPEHLSGLPVLFDCSCSGIQHLSTLCQDISLAKMVNVIPEGDRADLYSIAADYVINEINTNNSPGISASRNDLNKLIINRDILKTPIMTISYNISLNGLTEQLINKLSTRKSFDSVTKTVFYHIDSKYVKDGSTLLLSGSAIGSLAGLVYNSLFKLSPNLKSLVTYLNGMIKLLYKLNKPIIWITPAGMKINLSSIKYQAVKTKTILFRGAKPITLQIPTNKLDTEQIRRGFMPNMVHSMDAANIHILIQRLIANGVNIPLYTIHDCFATTPNNMGILDRHTKGAFIEMYLNTNYFATQLLKRTR
jgi:DNA-directed RNA polymerase